MQKPVATPPTQVPHQLPPGAPSLLGDTVGARLQLPHGDSFLGAAAGRKGRPPVMQAGGQTTEHSHQQSQRPRQRAGWGWGWGACRTPAPPRPGPRKPWQRQSPLEWGRHHVPEGRGPEALPPPARSPGRHVSMSIPPAPQRAAWALSQGGWQAPAISQEAHGGRLASSHSKLRPAMRPPSCQPSCRRSFCAAGGDSAPGKARLQPPPACPRNAFPRCPHGRPASLPRAALQEMASRRLV